MNNNVQHDGVPEAPRSKTAQREAENIQLVMQARAGDGPAFSEVWSRALVFLRRPMLAFLAHLPRTHLAGRRVERDDVMQEGLLGAWRAVLDFDPARGRALVHVAFRARSAMQAYLRRQVTLRRLHAEDPAHGRSANDVFAADLAGGEPPHGHRSVHGSDGAARRAA